MRDRPVVFELHLVSSVIGFLISVPMQEKAQFLFERLRAEVRKVGAGSVCVELAP